MSDLFSSMYFLSERTEVRSNQAFYTRIPNLFVRTSLSRGMTRGAWYRLLLHTQNISGSFFPRELSRVFGRDSGFSRSPVTHVKSRSRTSHKGAPRKLLYPVPAPRHSMKPVPAQTSPVKVNLSRARTDMSREIQDTPNPANRVFKCYAFNPTRR